MKFLCDNCKAKYQIGDDKVAGKTVRMKCRKCGHLIELRAEVTESSAMGNSPGGSATAVGGSNDATSRAAALKPPARPPPKPNALATSLTSTKPAPSPPKADRVGGGALAGAFKSNVQREDEGSAPFDMADLAPGDDWYVAVNGVPVGPIRVGEVRRKAALGAVTEESLVWQEGLDEWRPLKTFPDLAANVREAAGGGRISITPPPPEVRKSVPPRPPPPRAGTTSSGIPIARAISSRPIPTPAQRSNVVAFTARTATAEKFDEAPTEIGALAALASATTDPFAIPAPVSPAAIAPSGEGVRVAASSLAPPYPSTRKQPPWMAIAMIAAAVAFGTVFGISVFFKQSPPAQVVVQVPAAPAALPAAAPVAPTAMAPAEAVPSAAVAANTPGAHPVGGGASRTAPTAPTSTGRSLDLHSLSQGANVAPGEDPGGEPAAPGQCLSGGQVQQVIGLHQLAIRRACWERNPTAKPSVNVSVAMTVGPDGSAQSVSASGDELSVAKCIENDVRGWHFPAMGCSQKTGFSFKFVRQ